MNNRVEEVKTIINQIIKQLNKIEMTGYYLNYACTVYTYLQDVSLTENGTYEINLITNDLKIGGPEDLDDNDSKLEENLRSNFIKLLKKHSKDLFIVDTAYSEKGHWYYTVSFKSDKKINSIIKKINTLNSEISQYKEELISFNNKILQRILNQKSKKKTCPICDSNITVSYFKSHKCPVCNSPMYTSTDIKRVENLTKRIKDREAKVRSLSH